MKELEKIIFFNQALTSMNLTLEDEELSQISSLFTIKEYKKGQNIIEEGDSTPCAAFIARGLTRMYVNTIDGKEFISAFFRDGQFFMNYFPIMTGENSPFFTEALEDCQLLVADYFELDKSLSKNHFWHKVKQRFYEYNFIVKVKREIQFLTVDAKQRYINLKNERPDIVKRVSQQHLALFLGITPVSLSRIVKSLKEEN